MQVTHECGLEQKPVEVEVGKWELVSIQESFGNMKYNFLNVCIQNNSRLKWDQHKL